MSVSVPVSNVRGAYVATVNRAKPDAEELSVLFASHIAKDTLALCYGLKSYHCLPAATGCTVKECHELTEEEKDFFNLNTVKLFHSFIKQRYDFCQCSHKKPK